MSDRDLRGHERYEELAVGHALHALEPDDERLAVAHLAGCARCRAVADDTAAALAELALAAPVEPPAGLGERLREAVEREADERGPAGHPRTAPPVRPARGSSPVPTLADHRHARRRGTTRRLADAAPWLLAAAAVAALAVVTGWGLSASADRDRLVGTVALREQVLDRLADPDARVVRLAAEEGDASAAVLVAPDGRAYVVVDGLAPNDPGESTYVLWEVPAGGAPLAVGTFDVAEDGVAVAEVGSVTVDPERLAALAVSREAGRTAPPTPSPPLLAGTPA